MKTKVPAASPRARLMSVPFFNFIAFGFCSLWILFSLTVHERGWKYFSSYGPSAQICLQSSIYFHPDDRFYFTDIELISI